VTERDAVAAPRVSVALGTHNGARYLAEQLGSILAQTRPVDEIVLSDDASRDDTVAIAERLVAEHRAASGAGTPALVVLRNDPPLGVTANFERALAEASGDLVVLCDQDDVWRPDRIERALAALAARPGAELVASDARLVDAAGAPIGLRLFETLGVDPGVIARLESAPLDELLRRNLLTGATMLVRRELVERARPFPASWVHDEWLAIVAATGGGIVVADEALIDYRQHGANQIGVTKLSLDGRLGRLRAPRTERNARLLARASDLAQRLPAILERRAADASAGTDAGTSALASIVDDKLEHERVRSALPPARLRRIAPVVREWRTGRYGHYGRGAQDVLRDLVQPV
jgi:glycosyltransferase involved in cell wall biosynthesis